MTISGPEILVRALSKPTVMDRHGNAWNYNSRSDRHSKVACWALCSICSAIRGYSENTLLPSGLPSASMSRSEIFNTTEKRTWIVICQPASGSPPRARTLTTLADHYQVELTKKERAELEALPELRETQVESLLVALEAKACMTAHQRALPRLYDELNSSHATVHGAHDLAIAAGFVMINSAELFEPRFEQAESVHRPLYGARMISRSA